MRAESTIETLMSPCSRPGSGAWLWNAASETSAAAPPPTPLTSATICGIAVIFTLRAATAPKTPPTAMPTRISQTLSICLCANVTPIAISLPTAPIQLPRRAVAGCERNLRARMKATIVARYARSVATRPIVLLRRLAPLEHLEHSVGDDEAADDVRRRERHGDEADDRRQRVLVAEARDEHGPDDHDPVDRVRAGHQRGVEERRHLRDHLEAEEDREHEDRHLEDEQEAMAHPSTSFREALATPTLGGGDTPFPRHRAYRRNRAASVPELCRFRVRGSCGRSTRAECPA